MKYKILFYTAFIMIIAGLSFSQTDNLTMKLEEYMAHAEKAGFLGSVLVAVKDKVLLSSGYGMADKKREIPFTADTVSTIGSITKQFTGAGILKLQMMGKLNVKDPITKYFQNIPEDKKDITLHHLLTHSAGFPGAIGHDFDPISRKEFIQLAMNTKLERKPGTLYEYSNVGYSLLGIIIELVSGKSYEEFLHENLFSPAGMMNTGYLIPAWDKKNLAHGYRGKSDWGTLLDHPWLEDGPGWHLRGNGGILSTVKDMYKWHKALEGNTILGEEGKKLYYHPHIR
ncbi:MAG: serine hydrolase domain-containing protein, partial [Acidobacteriota bacterium]|nr:serine hydrolase domain-containing protein [Acidobacteriota bacterium]